MYIRLNIGFPSLLWPAFCANILVHFSGRFSKIRLDVDDKCCLFQEGGHLGPNLPPPNPVWPHFSPPDSIQRHHLAGFMKTVTSDTRSPHTLN